MRAAWFTVVFEIDSEEAGSGELFPGIRCKITDPREANLVGRGLTRFWPANAIAGIAKDANLDASIGATFAPEAGAEETVEAARLEGIGSSTFVVPLMSPAAMDADAVRIPGCSSSNWRADLATVGDKTDRGETLGWILFATASDAAGC